MITLDEKIVAVWYLQPTPTQDILLSLREVKPEEEYEIVYRFRYYDGDQDKNPFEDGDTKRWYKGTATGTRHYVLSSTRMVVSELYKKAKIIREDTTEPYELVNEGDITEFYRKFEKAPFVYVKQVSKEEGEKIMRETK